MSLKRPLSPESNHNDIRQLKRLKLRSIIEELRNEEANLVLLKKLRTSQQLLTRTNNNSTIITNGLQPPAARQSVQLPTTRNSPLPQQSLPTATRKSTKISSTHSVDERRTHAKLALRKQLEHDLLNIPLPKPSLQDILFIPNGTSLEFQPFLGLEDVIQCLNELYNDRHRLPQRFTDRAHIDEPNICHQCGTDFTIRWWKHSTSKSLNILCDRCKKQATRRTSKSEHSSLLKNVFISAMEKEKDIEKQFATLIKQQKDSSRSSSTNTCQIPSSTNYQYQKPKSSLAQNFASKLPQPSTRKSNIIIQSQNNHPRTVQQFHHHQQQYRSVTNLPQQMPKTTIKQQHVMPSSRSLFPSNLELMNSFLSSNLVRPTATKRRTFPTLK